MIRINLLPFRAAKKKEDVTRQLTIFGVVLIVLVLGIGYRAYDLSSQVSEVKEQEKRLNEELAALEKTVQQIAKMEAQIKEIKTKLGVIKDLEKGKTGPVHLLDEIAVAVPRDRLWLTSLAESGGVMRLSGYAMDNETVALFMTNLEKSEYITGVDLRSALVEILPQHRLSVSKFEMECRTYAFKDKAKPGEAAKK